MSNDLKIKKERLDILLVERNIFESREKAKIAIMEGLVFVDNQKEDKAGTLVKTTSIIEYRGEKDKYVSRGGYKLEKAIEVFKIDLNDKICMDIGSSTGGFTDCMLKNGAKKVYAIDCGTNQLDYSLRKNEKVLSLENTNARYINKETIKNDNIDFVSIDVSFISLTKILPTIYDIIDDEKKIVALIKPQFECGKDKVGNGIIKDKKIHKEVIEKIINFSIDLGLYIKGLDFSPIKGPKGNIEYLLFLIKDKKENDFDFNQIENIVNLSHEILLRSDI